MRASLSQSPFLTRSGESAPKPPRKRHERPLKQGSELMTHTHFRVATHSDAASFDRSQRLIVLAALSSHGRASSRRKFLGRACWPENLAIFPVVGLLSPIRLCRGGGFFKRPFGGLFSAVSKPNFASKYSTDLSAFFDIYFSYLFL